MHSLLSVVAPSIAMMLILIVAGRVAHEVMTAIKSGSAGGSSECWPGFVNFFAAGGPLSKAQVTSLITFQTVESLAFTSAP